MPPPRLPDPRRSSDRRRGLTRIAADRRGATIIEFAFVAGPLIALMIAILQVSLAFFAQQNLETATASASRQLMTGSAQAAGTNQAQFRQIVCGKLPSFMKCANTYVDVRTSSDFTGADTSTTTLTYDKNGNVTNNWAYSPGAAGQITTVKVFYLWQTSTGPLGFDLSTMSGSNRLLIATSVFQTEPGGS